MLAANEYVLLSSLPKPIFSIRNGVCAMLVLTRKLQQQIKIGDQITVTILRVKGNTVRVGITAPREVRVVRGELPKEVDAVEASTAVTAADEMVSAASEELAEAPGNEVEENVISFRVRCVTEQMPAL